MESKFEFQTTAAKGPKIQITPEVLSFLIELNSSRKKFTRYGKTLSGGMSVQTDFKWIRIDNQNRQIFLKYPNGWSRQRLAIQSKLRSLYCGKSLAFAKFISLKMRESWRATGALLLAVLMTAVFLKEIQSPVQSRADLTSQKDLSRSNARADHSPARNPPAAPATAPIRKTPKSGNKGILSNPTFIDPALCKKLDGISKSDGEQIPKTDKFGRFEDNWYVCG